MNLMGYMEERFPRLELIPSIYNQWSIGIHFYLGGEIFTNSKRMKN
ncbi:uncharacterized protein S100333_02195 [Bacillus subtilis subsp. subtilis]|nr:uncharacterized protein S100333_02195 [Bacillus subtilis subsp. subtilis]